MIESTFDPYSFKTVPSTYSWDQGTPGIDGGFIDLLTDFSVCTAAADNELGYEFVGYAPFVFISLSSHPGTISDAFLALRRTTDFGDYYNSESNLVIKPGLRFEDFCHVYIMPGLYTITHERAEYMQVELEPFTAYGLCLQKYCIDWSFKTLSGCPLEHPVTWGSTKTGGQYQKTWKFEPCEETWAANNGLYVQQPGKEERIPLSWQWFNFLKQSINPHNDSVTWLSAGFQKPDQITWKESTGPCIEMALTEATTWKWEMIGLGGNPFQRNITWDNTKSNSPLHTTWDFTKVNCFGSSYPLLSANNRKTTRTSYIRVLEIPPTAYLVTEQPSDRSTPLTVRLSPRNTISGSFPIDRIVWDLGDGSPQLVQRRWSNTLEEPFIYSGALDRDYQDPRNYDIIYTYTRSVTSQSSFYPSITAYSSSTNTSDSAAAVVGPITFANTAGNNFTLIQNELTDYGKVILGQIDNNVSLWRASTAITDVITLEFIYSYLNYWSSDSNLLRGISKLYYTRYSNSAAVVSLTGIGDIDKDGNLDSWYTNLEGVVNWEMIIVYPYSYVGYYSSDETLKKGETILYGSQGSAAVAVNNAAGAGVDLDNDGNLDSWTTDEEGIINWNPTTYYPYNNLGYYTATFYLYNNVTRLWSTPYSGATYIPRVSGISDVDQDGNIDNWRTDNRGYLSWNMILVHPHPRVGYYSNDDTVLSGSTILWSGPGTGATRVRNASGNGIDINEDGNTDTWFTNEEGVVSYYMTVTQPYGHFGYYSAHLTLSSGVSMLYNGRGDGAVIISSAVGVADVDIDGNLDNWSTNTEGVITYSKIVVHPRIHFGGYYSDDITLVSGHSKIWNGDGTGATVVANSSGVADVAKTGNDHVWVTNAFGTITHSKIIVHPYAQFNNYYADDATLVNGYSVLWNGDGTGANVIANSSGIDDVDGDGKEDRWFTGSTGRILWETRVVHLYQHFGYYSDYEFLQNGVSILWVGEERPDPIAASLSGIYDIDVDGNNELWNTNVNGVVSWYTISAHPFRNINYFTDSQILSNGTSVIWSNFGTGGTIVSATSGIYDIDIDGDNELWSTNNQGIVTWYTISAYPYRNLLGYYSADPSLISGSTVLRSKTGTGATTISSLSGVYDVNGDGDDEIWSTDSNGIINFTTIIFHPYPRTLSEVTYYTDAPGISNGFTVLWTHKGTGSKTASAISGTHDIDVDGNDEFWNTNNAGIISWYTISAHPYKQLQEYYTDTATLNNQTTVLWGGFGTGATTVANITGVADIDVDGNNELWTTNNTGIISWYTISAHPYRNLGYYTNTEFLDNGITILWSGFGTGATRVTNISGIGRLDLDSFNDYWTTDQNGVLSWIMIPLIGRYWFSSGNSDWYALSSWFLDSAMISSANTLPLSTTDVVILSGGVKPYVNLDDGRWRDPSSINAEGTGITFYSRYGAGVTSQLSGTPITFLGSAKFGATVQNAYWNSYTNTDWFTVSSWYKDYVHTTKLNTLPTSASYVYISSGGLIPYVNLDDNRWIQPIQIDATIRGITFYSNSSASVTCNLSGSVITFEGNSNFGQ